MREILVDDVKIDGLVWVAAGAPAAVEKLAA